MAKLWVKTQMLEVPQEVADFLLEQQKMQELGHRQLVLEYSVCIDPWDSGAGVYTVRLPVRWLSDA